MSAMFRRVEETYFLMIIKNTIPPERTGADDVAVGQDITALRIHHKPSGLATHRQVRVKRARLTEMNGDDALHHRLNCSLPLGRIRLGRAKGNQTTRVLVILYIIDGAVGRGRVSRRQDGAFGLEVFRGTLGAGGDGAAFALCASVAVQIHSADGLGGGDRMGMGTIR